MIHPIHGEVSFRRFLKQKEGASCTYDTPSLLFFIVSETIILIVSKSFFSFSNLYSSINLR